MATAPRWLDPREQSAWRAYLDSFRLLVAELDRQLEADAGICLTDYEVLVHLSEAPERRLRMSDLAQSVMLSSGGLTRLVGRLESRGLVERIPDSDDGRSFHAALTKDGSKRLADARVTHDVVIEELLSARLTAGELRSLTRALGRGLEP